MQAQRGRIEMAGIRLSYLCPIKNDIHYLDYMVQSVLSQCNEHVEIVFVDGKSTDGTYERLLELQKQAPDNIQVHVEENDDAQPGPGRAWNHAASKARGDILGWLGGDDASAPGATDFAIRFFDENPDANVIAGHCRVIDSEGALIMMHTSRQTSRDELLQGINPISCPASFYRTTLFHDVGGVDAYGNDFELFMNMSVGNEIVPVDAVLGEFRIHGASETGNLKSYIRTLKLDAEVITKHSKRYFSPIRWRYLVARAMEIFGLGFLLTLVKQARRRNKAQA